MVSRPAGPEESLAMHLVPANATLVPTNINAVILRSSKTFEVKYLLDERNAVEMTDVAMQTVVCDDEEIQQ